MMKQNRTMPKGKLTATQYRRRKVQKVLGILLKIVLVLSMILFVWITDLGCAFGWIKNAKAGENWPPSFVGYGEMMIAASVLLTAGAVLVFLRRNWISLGVGTVGIVLCLIPMFRVTAYAADSGFYSRIMDMPVDTLYRMQILPTLIFYGTLAALALLQFFSVEAKQQRIQKRKQAEAEAPSILGGAE